jgi:hypothetical protein
MRHTMHLQPGVAKQPNLELKTRPKQLLDSLPLVIALPGSLLEQEHQHVEGNHDNPADISKKQPS